ncbi:1-acyl-sn-glycerol-3-phosphate acyltransferase [Peptacetobacter hominis]|uniref:1-acyl-sn-glycerol-3-phosphate acyltransferase n=1 Tax=Peptacetobacter hominis TaxID=2743610 RepID=A0A544QVQ7_9FIRM|nr:lysophospholipid acyltransferase family protein [Peptacetobacter hominis]TQQ84756.1 1-acyl-sn-glycerol-3-phosphate acyltransferase [Peptacetobacter hominis]
MFNYIKFAITQIVGFIFSLIPLSIFKSSPDKYSQEDKSRFLNLHAKKSLKRVKINLDIKGRENIPDEPALFVANHSSMLDGFILMASIEKPFGCVIADEPVWRNIPIVRKWASLVKCVYMNRENNREGMKSIIKAAENIKNGQYMAIFPEGDLTWVKDNSAIISDFKAGALKIAYKAKCPIVPVAIKNSKDTYEGYQPYGKINSKDVCVEFLKPVVEHIENPRCKTIELAEKIRCSMIESIVN